MSTHQFLLVDNPDWAGRSPPDQPLTQSACHDRSHFITVQCACGAQMHMHESAVRGHRRDRIGSRCHGCGDILTFEPGFFQAAFANLRRQGWIA